MAQPNAPRVVVVGLGPGDPDLVTRHALGRIEQVEVRYLRTRVHPSAHLADTELSFDHLYEQADSFDEVYESAAETLISAATEHGEVLYAVPGSPTVLERTVQLLRTAAEQGRICVEVGTGVSFLDLAWERLGIDPYENGVRLVDGHRFSTEAAGERGPLLVAHCHNDRVLSDIKLSVTDPPDAPVVVLSHLGLPDESVTTVAWDDLDRVKADHLCSIFVPELAEPPAVEVARFVELVETLRRECPWDAKQTHGSLRGHLLEETYEVLEALDALAAAQAADEVPRCEGASVDLDLYAHLEEELGDLLFQIVFHATLAAEEGAFSMADVARGIHDKLVHRHPHVFGDVVADEADDVVANWEQIKKAEKGRESVFDGIPSSLPALVYAAKVVKKAQALGVTVGPGDDDGSTDIGQNLLTLVAQARSLSVDAEAELRAAADVLRSRASKVEHGR